MKRTKLQTRYIVFAFGGGFLLEGKVRKPHAEADERMCEGKTQTVGPEMMRADDNKQT